MSSTIDSPATLLFVRHADVACTRGGHPVLCGSFDAPLSDEGRRQVALLRRRLAAEKPPDAVYASPLRRALDTANAAPGRHPVRIVKSLAEIDCGIVDGLPIEEVRQRYPAFWLRNEAQNDENFAWPGGESCRSFRRRVLRVVRAIARLHGGGRVLLFTHAGVINQILGSLTGQSAARWESPRPRNTSLTRILWSPAGGSVVSFDDCSHLETATACSGPEAQIRTPYNPKPVGRGPVGVEPRTR